MRNCAAMGQWRATHAIAERILAADSGHAEARRHVDDARTALARTPSPGRNDPCPCGSGKRYKLCHGALPSAPSEIDDPDARTREGIAAHQAGRLDEAERAYATALAIAPGHPYASHLGVIAMQRRNWEDAVSRLERAATAQPDEPEFHGNLGLAYMGVGRLDDAVTAHRRAIALQPHSAAFTNLGLALLEQRKHAEAIAAHDQALALDPAYPQARWNRGMVRLALGDRGGWEDYDARLRLPELGAGNDVPGVTRWRGGDIDGKTILVEAEQGYGDLFQALRFAKPLADRGARVVLRALPPIATLARTAPGIAEVVPPDRRPLSTFDPDQRRRAWRGRRPLGDGPTRRTCSPMPVEPRRRNPAGARSRACASACRGPQSAMLTIAAARPARGAAPLLERTIAWYSVRGDGEDQTALVPRHGAHLLDERNDSTAAALIGTSTSSSACDVDRASAGAPAGRCGSCSRTCPTGAGAQATTSRGHPQARLFSSRRRRLGLSSATGTALDSRTASPRTPRRRCATPCPRGSGKRYKHTARSRRFRR
jgi:Flp pilus assembly protein TadD